MILPWFDRQASAVLGNAFVSVDGPMIQTSLTPQEAHTLGELAKGRRVIEVGSAFGYSAIVMALSGAETVTAIDPHDAWVQDSAKIMRANVEAYGVSDRLEIHVGRSENVLPVIAATPGRPKVDLIFIDGDHSEHAVDRDVRLSLPLLEEGGILACHDFGEDTCPGVKRALDHSGLVAYDVVDTLWLYRND